MPNRALLAAARRPVVRRLITESRWTRSVVDRFVAGRSAEDALQAAKRLASEGIESILDQLGENVATSAEAESAAAAYRSSLDLLEVSELKAHISVKPTQLGLDQSSSECLLRFEKLCSRAADIGTIVAIDMESHEYTERTIEIYRQLRMNHDNVALCLQAYLRRTEDDVRSLLPLDPVIRLCKGAYNEPREIAFGRSETTQSFRRLMHLLLTNCTRTAIATHDEHLIDHATRYPRERFELQMLFGVRRDLQNRLSGAGHTVRVYIPFGAEWYPYLMRRLAERPANLRFFLESLLRG